MAFYCKLKRNRLKSQLHFVKSVNTMLTHDEKRNDIRMQINCEIGYKFAGTNEIHRGHCTSISGSGVSFLADRLIDQGKALEINIAPKNAITPPMTAFIEVIRITRLSDGKHEIAATIKSIKGS